MPWRILPLLLLAGCGLTPEALTTIPLAVGIGSIAIIGRTPMDAVYSAATGQDCSLVRLDKGQSYCRPVDPPVTRPAFCTRSLGVVDCWRNPAALPGDPPQVADYPMPTRAQEAYRTRSWPF